AEGLQIDSAHLQRDALLNALSGSRGVITVEEHNIN
ncbi:hypothetical protein PSYMO_37741, partial [Pseudomonas amygdali pv. mori str. 301020]